jgi:flavin-dependent dehydrogenase
MASKFYYFVIVGGGPAGLTAGIVAARNGFKAVVLEKGDKAGPKPRGEGMKHFPLVDEILGDGFLPSVSTYSAPTNVFHSPGDLQKVEIQRKGYKHHFFHWRKFIDRFVEVAKEAGVELLLNCEVTEAIKKDNVCVGVKYKDKSGKVQKIYGNAVFGCDGYESVIGRAFGIDYSKMNCQIMKCLVSNGNIDIYKTPGLQFFLIGNGDLEYAPNFPQCVAYVFPIGGKNLEVGLMLRMMKAFKMKTVKEPSAEQFMKVWEKVKREYPGFSEFLKGSKIEYEELTALPNAKLADKVVPYPGAALIGDSAGFIEASGSSGLYFSMAMAKFWVETLGKKLKSLFGADKEIGEQNNDLWSTENIENFLAEWDENEVNKHIKKVYKLVGILEWYVFKRRRTSERINKRWKLIKWMFNKGLG